MLTIASDACFFTKMLTTDKGKSLHMSYSLLYVLCLNGVITCYISGVQSLNHHNGITPLSIFWSGLRLSYVFIVIIVVFLN